MIQRYIKRIKVRVSMQTQQTEKLKQMDFAYFSSGKVYESIKSELMSSIHSDGKITWAKIEKTDKGLVCYTGIETKYLSQHTINSLNKMGYEIVLVGAQKKGVLQIMLSVEGKDLDETFENNSMWVTDSTRINYKGDLIA